MEILIALGLLGVLVAVALPMVSQASRNLYVARESYAAMREAQVIMHSVRSAGGDAAESIAAYHAGRLGVYAYTVWIFGAGGVHSFSSANAPAASAAFGGMVLTDGMTAIAVMVFTESPHVTGRAVGLG